MRPVIVPLDGSALGSTALGPATQLALAQQLPLHLVHVPTATAPLPSLDNLSLKRPHRSHAFVPERAEEFLDELAQKLRDGWGMTVDTAITPRAEPAEVSHVLAEYAAVCDASLVVMSTRGHSGLARLALGSVADGLLRRSRTPLLLFPPGAARPHSVRQRFQRVLVPLDGSAASAGVLDQLPLVPTAPTTMLTLLRVLEPVPSAGDVPLGGAQALDELRGALVTARRSLAETASSLAGRYPGVLAHVQVAPLAAEAILSYARQWEADLIALTSSGRGGWERLRVGSVAAQLVAAAPCPLLVARTKPEAGLDSS